MSEIKVNLSITLPGRVLLSEQECSKNPETSYDTNRVEVYGKKGRETIVFKTRKCQRIKQSINLSRDAYKYMVSEESCLPSVKPFFWKTRMSKKQRLEAHLKNIVEELGGESFEYEVFED